MINALKAVLAKMTAQGCGCSARCRCGAACQCKTGRPCSVDCTCAL